MNDSTQITNEERPSGVTVVTINGDLDSLGTHTVEPEFSRAIRDRNSRILVDLTAVSFISSAGMAMLLVKGKMLRQGGGAMVLSGANERVIEVLSMAGFNELFDIYATRDEALAALE